MEVKAGTAFGRVESYMEIEWVPLTALAERVRKRRKSTIPLHERR